MNLVIILLCTIATIAVSTPLNDVNSRQDINYRLPTAVIPTHYDIELTPYFESEGGKPQFTFDGTVSISLSTTMLNVNQIVLHVNNLDISRADNRLFEELDPTRSIQIINRIQDEITDKFTIILQYPLVRNTKYILYFRYVGQIGSNMWGFYRSSYVVNGTTQWIGATQLEPTYARRVFPCFDEPSFKSTFVLKINRPAHFIPTLSNTQIIKTEQNVAPNRIRETFDITPVMSTYLLAFLVSEYRIRENLQNTFGIAARPEAYSQTEYAYTIGQAILNKLDNWTNYKYESVPDIKKMHMAALPDFGVGAMENWGLILFKESSLLYDPEVSNILAQQHIATIIAHELAHMWFGNLVTCDWWKYIWLNEGFARYFQYFGTAMVEKSWGLEQQFVVDQLQSALLIDSLEKTHPMTYDVNSPDEVWDMFDAISYNKAAAVIRMIENLIGSSNFNLAIQNYLQLNAYSTSTPEKLYAALQQTAGESVNIASIMSTWTTQAGYPVVNVFIQSDRKSVNITQQRFFLQNKNQSDLTMWEIPLNYASPNDDVRLFTNNKTLFMLTSSQNSLKMELNSATDWLIFNIQQTGYYRVNYDVETWTNIAHALKTTNHSGIHLLNRAQIIDDCFNLARAEYIDYKLALSIIQYIQTENHYIPWLSTFNNMKFIIRRLKNDDVPVLKNYILSLIDNIYNRLGFDEQPSDSRVDIYNRLNVLSYACKYNHSECITSAKLEFTKFMVTQYRVPVNIRPVVYCTAVTEGGNDEWTFLWNIYKIENVAAEKEVILEALGCTKDPIILRKYLNNILTDDIRLQDKKSAFAFAYNGHQENLQIVLDFVLENFSQIQSTFSDMSIVGSILSELAERFTCQEHITQLEQFYNQNKAEFGVSKVIPNSIDDAKFNLKWAERHVPDILTYYHSVSGAMQLTSVCLVLTLTALFRYIV